MLCPCTLNWARRFIVAMAFSGDGNRLVVVTGDNRHQTYIYHWRSKRLIYTSAGHNGQPPVVCDHHIMRLSFCPRHTPVLLLLAVPHVQASIHGLQPCLRFPLRP